MTTPEYVTFSNLIVDDIVLGDGRTWMNTLGGSGTHALSGMRVWGERLGYVAYAGADFDPQHRAQLAAVGVDLRGIVLRPEHRTARAWQLIEPDDRRVEIFRTSLDEFAQLRPQFSDVPGDYQQARGFHIQWGTPAEQAELVARLRAANPQMRLVCEPALGADGLEEYAPLLRQIDLFSPDRAEAQALTGTDRVAGMFEALLDAGARMVALRMGAAGSLIGTAAGAFYRVPAVPPAQIIDTTGAGNAYCGGFLVGLGNAEEPALAAARAATSASFALEQFGVPRFDEAMQAEAVRRLAWALARVAVVDADTMT